MKLVFEGAFGCFSRPEFATERLSYDIPPLTAARGMIEPIFWKPEIRYRVLSVAKLRHSSGQETRFMRVTTNEVKFLGQHDDVGHKSMRTQRRNLILRYPAFLIEVAIAPGARQVTKSGHTMTTYYEMLKRRVDKGQCIETPYLGMRDYPAIFRHARADDVPLRETRPLGPMSYTLWEDNWAPPDEPIKSAKRSVTIPSVVMVDGVVDMREWEQ